VTRSKLLQIPLLSAAAVLVVIAIWLSFDNPEIDDTSRGDNYMCLAPWDTALNDADNFPGGEPPPDAEVIAARCSNLGHERFYIAVASGSAALILTGLATALTGRRSSAGGVRSSA
jgi:hypothetical protein